MLADDTEFQPAKDPVGLRLKRAREAMGLSVADLVAHTRVQERFLRAIEASDYAALPGRAYAFGFARSYATHVGLDPDEIIRDLRYELGLSEAAPADQPMAAFAPGDPARVPSAKFAGIAAAAALLLAGGGYGLWHAFSVPDASLPAVVTDTPTPQPSATASAPSGVPSAAPSGQTAGAPSGPVVFTALDSGLWVKFYDASGKVLMNKQMVVGESYTVPADAVNPMVWTGRPEALAVSVGGHPIGKLDDSRKTVHDLPVSAAALLARSGFATPQPAPANGSAMGQANRAAMPTGNPSGAAQSASGQTASGHSGTSDRSGSATHHTRHHDAAQPSGAPSGAAQTVPTAEKTSTVSQ